MKITDVKTICLRYPYETPIADGCNVCTKRESFLILVETDAGITGIGEAATFGLPLSIYREVADQIMKPLLVGEDPCIIERLSERLLWCCYAGGRKGIVRGVASAVDIALWDILGKVSGKPVYQLLGGSTRKVKAYASAGFYSPGKGLDGLKREMEGYLRQGYRAFKIKVGRTCENRDRIVQYMPSQEMVIRQEEDLDRVRAVREVIGPEACLMLDMNNTWGVDTVLQTADFLEEMSIYAIEEPIRGDNIEGYRQIRGALKKTLIAGGENDQGLDRYQQVLSENMLDIVQANLGWSGGFTEVRRIAAMCLEQGKVFAPHSFFSAVLTAANIHLAAALPNVRFIESEENPNPLRTELLTEPMERDADMAYILSDKPGLGIELNWKTVNKFLV